MSGKVKYIGSAVPTVFNVVAGEEQQIIEVRKAGEVFTLSNAVATSLVTTNPSSWEAAEGWEPPPYEPPEAETLTVTSAYTLGTLVKRLFCNAQSASFAIKLPSPVGLEGKEYVIVNTASNTNTVTLETLGGEIQGPNLEPTTKLKIGKTEPYYAVTIIAAGGIWHVV